MRTKNIACITISIASRNIHHISNCILILKLEFKVWKKLIYFKLYLAREIEKRKKKKEKKCVYACKIFMRAMVHKDNFLKKLKNKIKLLRQFLLSSS